MVKSKSNCPNGTSVKLDMGAKKPYGGFFYKTIWSKKLGFLVMHGGTSFLMVMFGLKVQYMCKWQTSRHNNKRPSLLNMGLE